MQKKNPAFELLVLIRKYTVPLLRLLGGTRSWVVELAGGWKRYTSCGWESYMEGTYGYANATCGWTRGCLYSVDRSTVMAQVIATIS